MEEPGELSGRPPRPAGHVWRFGDCELDELRRELRVGGTPIAVEGKPLDLLRELLRHAGEVVTKDELLEAVWPGVLVVEGSLPTAISKLRKVLGDDRIIVTLPRVGYRLGVPVQMTSAPPPESSDLHLAADSPVPGRPQWRLTSRLDRSPSSEVWLAEHPKTRERRVFKFAPDGEPLRGLKREVTLARLLRESLGDRPEFVRILEWNFDARPYFIESEYGGGDLGEWAVARGGLTEVPLDARLALFTDVARAVAMAHDLGVLHKDLKPGNILVDESSGAPQVRIADFGSASLLHPARLNALGITNLGFTQTGADTAALTGTVLYLAPELVGGQSPSPASDVYALGVLLYQMVAGDLRKPLAPGWEADVPDPMLRQDIADAACGDPARRLATAGDLVHRLIDLDRRRVEHEETERSRLRAEAAERRRAERSARRPVLAIAAVATFVAGALGLLLSRSGGPVPPRATTIAVLPFENVGEDPRVDFLRFALADEVATMLSRADGIAVRPFASTRGYQTGVAVDRIARDLKADVVVTGRFLETANQLRVTLEAVGAGGTRVIWRDTIDAPASSMIATQVQIGLRVREGLSPTLGATPGRQPLRPGNEEAYHLFLRSVALEFDAEHNAEAERLLERSVELDPSYPPAWVTLARRYYVESRYASGDPTIMSKYEAAVQHALAVDPGNGAAAAAYVTLVVERGELVEAYRRANDLVRRFPASVDAHFVLSYVLRYAGLLQESARHCETALVLDARTQTSGLRSCAIVFIQLGDYARALNFINLEPDSGFTRALSIDMLVRQGRSRAAVQVGSPNQPQWASYDMLLACIDRKPAREIRERLGRVRPADDPEANYLFAAHLAYCGDTARAADMLRLAVEGKYCSYPAVESDPLFAALRARPEYAAVRDAARACQRAFVEARAGSAPPQDAGGL